jgi:hypothetical protein
MAAIFFPELQLTELFFWDMCRVILKTEHGILYTTGRTAKHGEGD